MIKFAANDQIEALRPFIDEFWETILGTSYATSFVLNESTLDSWEHYVGGREILISRVRDQYGVDISEWYDLPIPAVLEHLRSGTAPN